MKKFLLSFICCLMAIISVQAQSEPCYTLTPTKGSNNGYATNCDINVNGITWNLTGNSTMDPWRIGGKSLTNVDRTLYSKTPMSEAVDKVVVTLGTASSITINSAKLQVASKNDFSDAVDYPFTAKASEATEINVTAAAGSYFKFVFNVTVSGSNNKYFQFVKADFYAAEVAEAAVATPTFSVEGGTYYNPYSVEIAAEEGATVYYTLDGTEPTAESAVYSEAIAFNEFGTSTTLKAIAVANGESSNIAIANYSLEVAAPVFSAASGVYTKLSGETALKFTCETEGATVLYNNRGGDPKTEGSKSWGSLSVLATAEVKAVAYVEVEGEKIYSGVVSEKYYISPVKPFEKATEFAAGQYLIHANCFAATALSETGNYGYLPQFAVEANGNFIETNTFYAFTFTKVEGGYTIQDTFGRYVYQKDDYNSFNVAAEMPAEGAVWTVAIDETTGEATITNTSVNKYIQYSAQHKSYGSYATAQSNAFKPSLYKLGEYPTITVTPENWETIPAFEKVTITCESGIKYNETDENYPYYTIGWDYTPYEFDNVVVVDENTIELTFNEPIADNGDYRVVLPAGVFILNPNGLAMPSASAQYTYTVENPNMLEIIYANPDNGDQVKSIEYLYFEYSQNIIDQVEGAVITNEKGEEFPLTVTYTDSWGDNTPYNALCLKTTEPITAAGTYTFVLKKEYAYTDAGVRLTEDITYTFTLVEGLKITGSTPANGAEVEAIEEILIEFNQDIICYAEAFMLANENGEEHYLLPAETDKDGGELPFNVVRMVAEAPITAAGTYTLYINEWTIVNSSWETLSEQTLTFTIPGAAGGEGEGEVDYTPANTGAKTRTGRNITSVSLGENTYNLSSVEQGMCYVDGTEFATFTVEAGATVKATVAYQGEWMHHAVFIDFDGDGFTSGIEEGSEWKPAGDLVAYAFYNNGGSSDEYGYNSVGTYMSGMDRHVPEIPEFAVPTTPGTYRIRFVQDWCSIDPNGDSDGKFGDFMDNGGQIVDVTLVVTEPTGIENVENVEVKAIYDLTGRKIETITKAGIYIVNGKKVLVK